jgi:hypothetical protein
MSDPPVPMRRVDEDLGYKRGFLKQYYPELCSEISERYRRFEIEAKQHRIERISQAIRQAVRGLHAENIYPKIQAVELAINVKGFSRQRVLHVCWKEACEEIGYQVRGYTISANRLR